MPCSYSLYTILLLGLDKKPFRKGPLLQKDVLSIPTVDHLTLLFSFESLAIYVLICVCAYSKEAPKSGPWEFLLDMAVFKLVLVIFKRSSRPRHEALKKGTVVLNRLSRPPP